LCVLQLYDVIAWDAHSLTFLGKNWKKIGTLVLTTRFQRSNHVHK